MTQQDDQLLALTLAVRELGEEVRTLKAARRGGLRPEPRIGTTPEFGWPYAEGDDFPIDFPTTVDQPRTLAIEATVADLSRLRTLQSDTRGATDTVSGTAPCFNTINLPSAPAGSIWLVDWWMVMTTPDGMTSSLKPISLGNCAAAWPTVRWYGALTNIHFHMSSWLTVTEDGVSSAALEHTVLAGSGTWTVSSSSEYFAYRIK